jgi:chromosome segregation ATPase
MSQNQLTHYLTQQVNELIKRYEAGRIEIQNLLKENGDLKNKLSILERDNFVMKNESKSDNNEEIERLKQKHQLIKKELENLRDDLAKLLDWDQD